MSNSPHAITSDSFEAFVASTLAAPPRAGDLASVDRRVAAALDGRPARPSRGRLPLRRVILLAAALAVLGGATTTLLSLHGGFGGDGYQYAWKHATMLGLSETHDGYAVTLEAAYGDAAQLMLAISAVDTENRGWSGIEAASADARLADATSPTWVMTGGGSAPGSLGSANTVWLDTVEPLMAGNRKMVVTVPAIRYREPEATTHTGEWWHEVLGPWTFTFDLPIAGGTQVRPAVTSTVAGITASLDDALITPTTARITVRWTGRDEATRSWASIADVYHDGDRLGIGLGGANGNDEVLRTVIGATEPGGHWKVVISELVGDRPDGEQQVRTQGPWVLEFDIP